MTGETQGINKASIDTCNEKSIGRSVTQDVRSLEMQVHNLQDSQRSMALEIDTLHRTNEELHKKIAIAKQILM